MSDQLPNVLPIGTTYRVNGWTYELLEPSHRRPNGRYQAPRRLCHETGVEHAGCVDNEDVSLDLADRGSVVVPVSEQPRRDPYVEHRMKIGDDK